MSRKVRMIVMVTCILLGILTMYYYTTIYPSTLTTITLTDDHTKVDHSRNHSSSSASRPLSTSISSDQRTDPSVSINISVGESINFKFAPKTNIFANKRKLMFLKTHKCATSTLVNMFYLYGIRRRLNFAMKPYDHWLGEVSKTIQVSSLLKPRPGQEWDMQVTHGIFNADGEHQVLPKKTSFYTTILRSPDTQLASSFYYFGEEKRQRMRWGNGLSKSQLIDKYLETARVTPTEKNAPPTDLGWKRFSMDLGSGMSVDDKIDKFIEFIDNEMDLMMISERFDESLIVFKEMMGWTFDDILYLNRNIAPDTSKSSLTPETQENIFNHLVLDKRMYDHFNATLDRHIEKIGREYVAEQMAYFQGIRLDFENMCFDKGKIKVMEWDTRSYELSDYGKNVNLACTFLQLSDVPLNNAISQLQNSLDYTKPILYKSSTVSDGNYIFQDIITKLYNEFQGNT